MTLKGYVNNHCSDFEYFTVKVHLYDTSSLSVVDTFTFQYLDKRLVMSLPYSVLSNHRWISYLSTDFSNSIVLSVKLPFSYTLKSMLSEFGL